MNEFSEIFISHATEDESIAAAWQELLSAITAGRVVPWYSGDKSVKGGIGTEEWRKKVRESLDQSKNIIVILTPGSNERPWVLFESGVAYGPQKPVIPVVHFMGKESVTDVFKPFQLYDGQEKADVFKVCETLAFDREVPEATKLGWEVYFEKFRKSIAQERLALLTRSLFQDHFHQHKEARKLNGTWAAKWIEVKDDGTEVPFEEDALYIWTTESRIRLVGLNKKKGIDKINLGDTNSYPMEGVVSSSGWIALSYWSAASIPICGTCLLKKKGATGRRYVGHWEGFTTRDIDGEDPQFTRGTIEFVKLDDKVLPPEEVEKIRSDAKFVTQGIE